MSVTYDANNPLQGVGASASAIAPLVFGPNDAPVRAPAGYRLKYDDVSAADSGRTEDTTMYKNRRGQVVGIELAWRYVTTAEGSAILQAFDPEYLYVQYLDLKAGCYCKAEFYVGNRSAPMYNARKGLWENVSFNLIKRDGTAPTPVT